MEGSITSIIKTGESLYLGDLRAHGLLASYLVALLATITFRNDFRSDAIVPSLKFIERRLSNQFDFLFQDHSMGRSQDSGPD